MLPPHILKWKISTLLTNGDCAAGYSKNGRSKTIVHSTIAVSRWGFCLHTTLNSNKIVLKFLIIKICDKLHPILCKNFFDASNSTYKFYEKEREFERNKIVLDIISDGLSSVETIKNEAFKLSDNECLATN